MIDVDSQITLISIETDYDRQADRTRKIISLRYENQGDSLTASYAVGEHQVRDEELVNVARAWFHKTCSEIAQATQAWAMDSERLQAAKHPLSSHPTVRL